MRRCLGCMAEIPDEEENCRYCGYQKGTGVKEAYYLLPGKVVGSKYMVGKVLGYGGFGVTYIGWDTMLKRKVAIKEYLPSDFATRSYGTEILTVFSGEATVQFEAGLNSFISEAKRLAKFNRVPEIVDIYDCFMENETGYIIMEYLEGTTVKDILKAEKRIPVERACKIAATVLKGLSEVHKEGIIHRDIAPDNIFITKKDEIKILDFGAARYATAVQSRSLSVILKPGYAPEEQYRSKGEQGPWTDVYAMGATLYRMITGVLPEESIERIVEDRLKTPSELGIEIDSNIENALMNSLNVKKEYRTQNAADFYGALESEEEVERVIEEKEDSEDGKMPGWVKWAALAAGALVCACIVLFATGNLSFTKKQISSVAGADALAENEFYVPDVSGMSYEEAEAILKEKSLNVVINGMNYSESIEKNKILSQNPGDGAKASAQETVYVIMSGGNQEVMMPDLSGIGAEEAKALVTAQNLVLEEGGIAEEYSDVVEKGMVISQSIPAEKKIGVKTKVSFTVSLGSLSEETAVLTVPDLTGMTQEEAIDALEKLKKDSGFTYPLGKVEKEFSQEVEKGKIISQGLAPNSKVRTDKPITLVISKGPEKVTVPNVVYLSREEAEKALKDAGLAVRVETEYSSMVSKGLVISQGTEAESQADKGSTVTVTISLGKEPEKKTTNNNSGSQNPPVSNEQPPQQPPQQPQPQQDAPPKVINEDGGGVKVVPDNGDIKVEKD